MGFRDQGMETGRLGGRWVGLGIRGWRGVGRGGDGWFRDQGVEIGRFKWVRMGRV